MGQVTAGFGATIASVDAQMLGDFSAISSYAEMKLEVLPMANGCGPISRKPAEESREFLAVGMDEGKVDLRTLSRL